MTTTIRRYSASSWTVLSSFKITTPNLLLFLACEHPATQTGMHELAEVQAMTSAVVSAGVLPENLDIAL